MSEQGSDRGVSWSPVSKRRGGTARRARSVLSRARKVPVQRLRPELRRLPVRNESASSPRIGHLLRARRRELDLTLDELAGQVGLAKSFLSDVENDKASPSIASLLQLCSALSLSVGSLFTTVPNAVVRAEERPKIKFYGVGLADFLLTARSASRLLVLWTEVQPGGRGGKQPYSMPCDENFVLVISGSVVFEFDDERHVLNAGDALTYSARRPHNFSNPSARTPATVLFVMTPPPN